MTESTAHTEQTMPSMPAKRRGNFYGKNLIAILSLSLLAIGGVTAMVMSQQRTELASKASSTDITIPVMEDSYVSRDKATKTYGDDKEVKVDEDKAAYLKFDLRQLLGQQVQKATLRLYVTNSSKSVQLLKNVPDTTWSETTLTYGNQPKSGDVIAQVANTEKKQWKDLDITQYIHDNAGKVVSLVIDASALNKNNLYFDAKGGANPPVLIVQTGQDANGAIGTTVPETTMPTAAVPTQMQATLPPVSIPPTVMPTYTTRDGHNVGVKTAEEFRAALDTAQAGDVITLADGTYKMGQEVIIDGKKQKMNSTSVMIGKQNASAAFRLAKSGTPAQRIVIQGSRNAIIDGDNDYALHLFNANYVDIKGITVINGSKGIMLDRSSYVIIDGVEVKNIAMEGIHLRSFSSNNEVKNSYVHHTGRDKNTGAIDDQYGEGLYVGTANSNWGTYTDGQVDKSDNNKLIGNRIEYTGGEGIDVKEGTSNGLIENNTFDNAGIAGGFADSWLDMKGNNWIVRNNKGVNAAKDGFQVHGVWAGWGNNNIFTNNVAAGVKDFGFWVQNNVTGNKINCNNTAPGAPSGLANIPCTN